jgi:hypothetical protein
LLIGLELPPIGEDALVCKWGTGSAKPLGKLPRLSNEKEQEKPVPALPPYLIEPIWEQFRALLPEREVEHPLGCHKPRIPDRIVFEKLVVQVLVFGCAYWRIADESCSDATLRR